MTGYPAGAGPAGARFGGEVYVPPSGGYGTPSAGGPAGPPATPAAGRAVQLTPVAVFNPVAPFQILYSYAWMNGPKDSSWFVRRIFLYCFMPTETPAIVYLTQDSEKDLKAGTLRPDRLQAITATKHGAMDENEAWPPYRIDAGWNLVVVWPAAAVGPNGTEPSWVRIEYDEA